METSKKSNLFKILVIVLLVLVLVSITILGYLTVNGETGELPKMFTNKNEEEHSLLLDEFLVNLNTENNQRSYLKTTIGLMYTDNDETDFINGNVLKIRDTIINDLRALSPEDILNSENIPALKASMKESINLILGKEVIKEIYFSDLIIQ